jgi:hypothetical protein
MDMDLISCFSYYIVSSVGWYVENGALRHITYGMSLFIKIQEKEGGMSVDLGDDATYLERGFRSIFFQIPSSGVIELEQCFV